jgi:hypothetical protein
MASLASPNQSETHGSAKAKHSALAKPKKPNRNAHFYIFIL